jgi:TfoX/Sxy family transcriptional regulator of competence genes
MQAVESFEHVVEAFSGEPGVTSGKMFGSLGLKVAGRTFAMEVKGRLVVKLPRVRVEELVATGVGAPFDPGHGRVMKEWVAVDASSGASWVELAREAHRYVGRS